MGEGRGRDNFVVIQYTPFCDIGTKVLTEKGVPRQEVGLELGDSILSHVEHPQLGQLGEVGGLDLPDLGMVTLWIQVAKIGH